MIAPDRHAAGSSRTALLFFMLALGMLGTAFAIAWGLMHVLERAESHDGLIFPPIFLLSTLLLAAGSFSLQFAIRAVRRERQPAFRAWLLTSWICAALFLGVQTYGLWAMFPNKRVPADASLGVTAPVVTLTTLHMVHFFVAALFVCFVAARMTTNRYDHEYYWGVSVCAWFWHALGIAWLVILCIFAIVL